MVLKAPVELEMRKSKDGLGFNIKGGRDRKFIEARDPRNPPNRNSLYMYGSRSRRGPRSIDRQFTDTLYPLYDIIYII